MTPEFIKQETLWLKSLKIAIKIVLWLGILGGFFGSIILGGIHSTTEVTHYGQGVLATDKFNYLVFFLALPAFWLLTFLITTVLNVLLNMAVRISFTSECNTFCFTKKSL